MDRAEFGDGVDDVLDLGGLPSRRSIRVTLGLAAVAVLIVGAAFVLLHTHNRHTPIAAVTTTAPAPSAPAPSRPPVVAKPSPTPTPTAVATAPVLAGTSKTDTAALLARLLAGAPVLPGATAQPNAPLAPLGQFESEGLGDPDQVVGQSGWWTAPGTVEAALTYYKEHIDPSLRLFVAGVSYSSEGPTVQRLSFNTPDTAYAVQIQLEIRVAPVGGGVGVGLRGIATWTPPRPLAETITAPTSLALTVERAQHPTVTRVLGSAVATGLASIVNSLQAAPANPGLTSCPSYDFPPGATADTLRFSTSAGLITVSTNPFSCDGAVTVIANGIAQPVLRSSANLDRAVLNALGLPDDYGYPTT